MTLNERFVFCPSANGFLEAMRPTLGYDYTCDGDGAQPGAFVRYEPLPDCGAVRYSGEIRSKGGEASRVVRGLHMARLSFDMKAVGQPVVHGAGGGPDDRCYPPVSFRRFESSPMAELCGSVEFGSSMGLSSNETLPFFVVSDSAGTCGFFLGLGWSGNWRASFSVAENADGSREFRVRAWLPSICTRLLPGETVPIPEALLGFYQGSPADGMNALRRTIWNHFTPKLAGSLPFPPVVYGTWFANGGCRGAERLSEQSLMRQADLAAEIGCEVFEIDLGWEAGSEAIGSFDGRRMDWEPSPEKFPHGLGRIADYARGRGMRFGLWFDVARTTRASRVAIEHPDWVLWRDDGSPAGVVDFGLPEARDWAVSAVCCAVESADARWIRMDYNLNPSLHWSCNDKPDRNGMTEIRHVQGYYEVVDRIMARCPELCVEQCAAGGRMIDLGTVRRGHMLFLCDCTASSDLCRYHLSGANCFLPAPMLDRNLADWCETYSDAQFLSRFGGAFGVSDNMLQWPRETVEKAARMIALYKDNRLRLHGDFHALFPQPQSLALWDGWQFHDEEDSSGLFFLFRSKSSDAEARAKLRRLEGGQNYSVRNLLTGEQQTMPGDALAAQGFPASLEADGAGLWSYAAVL